MRKATVILFSLALIFFGVGPMSASARQNGQQELPDLFTEPANPVMARDAQSFSDEVIRYRQVDVNTDLLVELARSGARNDSSTPSAFMLNLFDDAVYTATIDKVEEYSSTSFGMTGHVDGDEYNELILVIHDDILQGYLQNGQKNFEIRYENGLQTVREVDSNVYPAAENIPELPGEQSAPPADALPEIAADTAGSIDVLALYTPAARAAYGSAAAIESAILQSILSTNEGYTASGIAQQIRLVGMEEVSYTENVAGVPDVYTFSNNSTYSPEWYAALYRMTFGHYTDTDALFFNDPNDANYLADARAYRESYNADLVFLVTSLPYVYCGLGWIGGNSWQSSYGYSVVHYNCTGYTSYTVQHEMGHNMGACHDRANSSTTCMYDYSYGYQQPDQFYTVMAYSNGCGSCSRINRWSNPDLTYNGYPTGVAIDQSNSAHNVMTLNNTSYNVANYRQSNNAITASFSSPEDLRARFPRTSLEVSASSNQGSIVEVVFSVFYDYAWHVVETDTNSADGWGYLWPAAVAEGENIHLRAEILDSVGNPATIYRYNVKLSSAITIGDIYESRGNSSFTDESIPNLEDVFIDLTADPAQLPVLVSPWHTLPH